MKRKEILESAIHIVCAERQDQYGEPEDTFMGIAELWSVYLGRAVSAEDVALMMVLLKIARMKAGKFKADNYVDLCGYGALAYEVANRG
ncbi:MAG: hypothetical protein IKG03_05835 [Clostridiales bacterium]|nr:hypothetical protein [Clostridiales bacterium]